METDSFFCQLLKCLPQTFFELLGQPPERAEAYHFESIEIKKSFRIDGVCLPKRHDLPVYFVEVQFRNLETFYANLFAKVFLVMEANPSFDDWAAVAIFENRNMEPKHLKPYEDLLRSKRVTRVYLDEYPLPANPSPGLGLLHLVTAPKSELRELAAGLKQKAETEIPDRAMGKKVIELMEELLMRRFTELSREEIRKMFGLQDIRKSKVWQEAHEEGKDERNHELVRIWLAEGKSAKEISELMRVSVKEARRLVKNASK